MSVELNNIDYLCDNSVESNIMHKVILRDKRLLYLYGNIIARHYSNDRKSYSYNEFYLLWLSCSAYKYNILSEQYYLCSKSLDSLVLF